MITKLRVIAYEATPTNEDPARRIVVGVFEFAAPNGIYTKAGKFIEPLQGWLADYVNRGLTVEFVKLKEQITRNYQQ